ncbi:F390 synthetase-related protein [Pseudoduganella violaceinigra]|uniref:F390 synthetase-related protein n=1 Tax=Pseudoduganella violaceinigra TaxID=246602 RepID=UPI0004098EED|nr:F390 synthetase-related protein [Pseudoduganella violaceinigra]
MRLTDTLRLAGQLARTRWLLRFRDRAAFEAWQQRQVQRFLDTHLPRSPYYRSYAGQALSALPIVDKQTMLAHFDGMNTAGITLDEATQAGLAAETARDFTPQLRGITVGLSSGTSGTRGVFLVSPGERARWAGIMMARALPRKLMRQLLAGNRPVKVAFFLRANSNLYTTLKSRRVDFRFYDLVQGVDCHLAGLIAQQPDLLVAPARILGRLAELALDGVLPIRPERVISVAEVLEPDDKARIEQAFGQQVHQLYQCTEGFLAYTCDAGVLHLNEEFVHVEPEWLDEDKTRFTPIITDFSRTTQLIVRYRLGDVLRLRSTPCGCGAAGSAIEAIEGRCDDVLWLHSAQDASPAPLFPDMVRQAVASAPATLPDYRIEQRGMTWRIAVADEEDASCAELTAALRRLTARHQLTPPIFERMPFSETDAHVKRRRIRCVQRPTTGQEATHA